MRSLLTRMRTHKLATVLALGASVVALVLAAVVATEATSKPEFCDSCHEMTPFYAAWASGSHAGVDCVDCHVDPGIAAQVSHKAVALQEVYIHFTGDPRFPGAAEVPDSRCLACHDGGIETATPGFDHEAHRAGKPCVSCHAGIGHSVTSAALAEAGILDPEAFSAQETARVAEVGAGVANLEGHTTIVCSSCHDLAATGCESCHTPPAQHTDVQTTCTTCHTTQADWAFQHPADGSCVDCHATPAEHYGETCVTCHETGVTWRFTHPESSADCETCHTPPSGHSPATCTTCHTVGDDWEFNHPASTSCASCHTAPSRHYGTSCSSCHTPSKAWSSATFSHPSSSSTCLNCHTKPAGHYTSTCSSCHKTGVSWRFTHPTSTSCASCHKAPTNHYGTSCVSCHTPSRAWSSATFSHPRVPGGEHSYKSFSCVSCHPGGYSSYSCTKCHSSNNPDDDDD